MQGGREQLQGPANHCIVKSQVTLLSRTSQENSKHKQVSQQAQAIRGSRVCYCPSHWSGNKHTAGCASRPPQNEKRPKKRGQHQRMRQTVMEAGCSCTCTPLNAGQYSHTLIGLQARMCAMCSGHHRGWLTPAHQSLAESMCSCSKRSDLGTVPCTAAALHHSSCLTALPVCGRVRRYRKPKAWMPAPLVYAAAPTGSPTPKSLPDRDTFCSRACMAAIAALPAGPKPRASPPAARKFLNSVNRLNPASTGVSLLPSKIVVLLHSRLLTTSSEGCKLKARRGDVATVRVWLPKTCARNQHKHDCLSACPARFSKGCTLQDASCSCMPAKRENPPQAPCPR